MREGEGRDERGEERREIATIFTSELGFKSRIMRGFQKGITLGG